LELIFPPCPWAGLPGLRHDNGARNPPHGANVGGSGTSSRRPPAFHSSVFAAPEKNGSPEIRTQDQSVKSQSWRPKNTFAHRVESQEVQKKHK
jgi:hypothetical protein